MLLLVGSQAAVMNFDDFPRKPKDVDFIAPLENFQSWVQQNKAYIRACYPVSGKKYVVEHVRNSIKTMVEFEIAWPGTTAYTLWSLCLLGYCDQQRGYMGDSSVSADAFIAPPSFLLLLKESHKYLKNSPHFLKTMTDIHYLRTKASLESGLLKNLLELREKETYAYKHPNLKQSKTGFFDASVKYVYDHDSIHRAVMHMNVPAYELYKSDKAEVFCDRTKFFNADHSTRLWGVLEEAYVLALERSQIPFGDKVTPRRSFLMALEKVCTSITSGFFREWAWENYGAVVKAYETEGEDAYVKKFKLGVESGIVKLKENV